MYRYVNVYIPTYTHTHTLTLITHALALAHCADWPTLAHAAGRYAFSTNRTLVLQTDTHDGHFDGWWCAPRHSGGWAGRAWVCRRMVPPAVVPRAA